LRRDQSRTRVENHRKNAGKFQLSDFCQIRRPTQLRQCPATPVWIAILKSTHKNASIALSRLPSCPIFHS
jgi:hypothetical protein